MKQMIAKFIFLGFIFFITFSQQASSPSFVEKKLFTQNLKEQLISYFENFTKSTNQPAVVFNADIPDYGEFDLAVGLSDLQNNVPMNTSNHFRIASISKTFTGLSILMLYQQNKLSLNDTIDMYIDNITIPYGNNITIYQMLHMISGLPEVFEIIDVGSLVQQNPFELLQKTVTMPAQFPPGAKWDYCNTNFLIMGMIVEKITNQTLSEFTYENIINKYNLTNTVFPNTPYMPIPYSHGYENMSWVKNISAQIPSFWQVVNQNVDFVDDSIYNPSYLYGSAEIISTVKDITRYGKLLFTNQILDEKAQTALLDFIDTNNSFINIQGGSLEGFWTPCGTLIGKTGGFAGFVSFMLFDEESKITIASFQNHNYDQGYYEAVLNAFCIVKNSVQKNQNITTTIKILNDFIQEFLQDQ